MRTGLNFLALLVFVGSWLSFLSCSTSLNSEKGSWITKRKYRKGYHIDWPFQRKFDLVASNDTSSPKSVVPSNIAPTPQLDTIQCALMVLKNGDEFLVEVKQIKVDKIDYKNCQPPGDTIETIPKQKVLLIRYPDGSKDIFNEPSPGDTTDTKKHAIDTTTSNKRTTEEQQSKTTSQNPPAREWDFTSVASGAIGGLSFILFILAFLPTGFGLVLFVFALLFGIIAGALGIFGLSKVNNNEHLKGAGFSIFGLGVAILEVLFVLLVIFLLYAIVVSL